MSYRSISNIKIILWSVFFIVLAFFIGQIFGMRGGIIFVGKKDLLSVEWPEELEFAGEAVPLEKEHIREAWEKDFLILLSQDYQNILYLKRAPKYFPHIEEELAKRNLPEDLKYIAVAESGLIARSQSSAGAGGIWQFMPSTARERGLIVGKGIDERRHFEKSTQTALDYLEFIQERMNSWTLTAAAYNAGYNKIRLRLAEQEVDDYYDLNLNKETSRYLFRILAIKEIMEHPEKYGYELKSKDHFRWPKYEVKMVEAIENLVTWAKENGTTIRAIKEINPWILGDSLPDGSWTIKVPEE